MSDPETSYTNGTDAIRRNLNDTFYQRFFLDEQGVQASDLNPPFDDFQAALTMSTQKKATGAPASTTTRTKEGPHTGASDLASNHLSSSGLALSLTDILSGVCSSKASLVELPGIEPAPKMAVSCGNVEFDYAKRRQMTRNDVRIRAMC